MAELKPPKEFLDWLDKNYTWAEANTWRLSKYNFYKNDPVYQYWFNNVASRETKSSMAGTAIDYNSLYDKLDKLYEGGLVNIEEASRIEDLINGITTYTNAGELADTLVKLEQTGLFTRDEMLGVYETVSGETTSAELNFRKAEQKQINVNSYLDNLGASPEVKKYLLDYTTKEDLQNRVSRLGLGLEQSADILKGIIENTSPYEFDIRSARAGELESQQKRKDEISLMARQGQDLRDEWLQRQMASQGRAEDEKARSLVAGMQGFGVEQPRRSTTPIEPAQNVYNEFVNNTGYAQGSKLRSFIESQAPSVYNASERQSWWNNMNPDYSNIPTYQDEINRLSASAERWDSIANTAPTSATTGTSYWGEGGLAAMAQTAAQQARTSAQNLRPEDFPDASIYEKPAQTEDPFKKALRQKNWLAEYYRMPGTGTSSRYTPSVRF
jgi:hypothetical protein